MTSDEKVAFLALADTTDGPRAVTVSFLLTFLLQENGSASLTVHSGQAAPFCPMKCNWKTWGKDFPS